MRGFDVAEFHVGEISSPAAIVSFNALSIQVGQEMPAIPCCREFPPVILQLEPEISSGWSIFVKSKLRNSTAQAHVQKFCSVVCGQYKTPNADLSWRCV